MIEDRDEAMRLALLYVLQARSMTSLTAIGVIRALEQDGYTVARSGADHPDCGGHCLCFERGVRDEFERLVNDEAGQAW